MRGLRLLPFQAKKILQGSETKTISCCEEREEKNPSPKRECLFSYLAPLYLIACDLPVSATAVVCDESRDGSRAQRSEVALRQGLLHRAQQHWRRLGVQSRVHMLRPPLLLLETDRGGTLRIREKGTGIGTTNFSLFSTVEHSIY